ncbi:hypothetical protein JCM11641_002507 [Rhodosporidiobolus odoratus]
MGFKSYELYSGYKPKSGPQKSGLIVCEDGRAVQYKDLAPALDRIREEQGRTAEVDQKPLLLILDLRNLLYASFLAALKRVDTDRYPRYIGQQILDRQCFTALDQLIGNIHVTEPTAFICGIWDNKYLRPEAKGATEERIRIKPHVKRWPDGALLAEEERPLKRHAATTRSNRGRKAMERLRRRQAKLMGQGEGEDQEMVAEEAEKVWYRQDLEFPSPPSQETIAQYPHLAKAVRNGLFFSLEAPNEADSYIRIVNLVASGEISSEAPDDLARYSIPNTHLSTLRFLHNRFYPHTIVTMAGDSDIAVIVRSRSSTFHLIRSGLPLDAADDRNRTVALLDRRIIEAEDLWQARFGNDRDDAAQIAVASILGNDVTGAGLYGVGPGALLEGVEGSETTVGRALSWLPWTAEDKSDAELLRSFREIVPGKKITEEHVRRVRASIQCYLGLSKTTFDTRSVWAQMKQLVRKERAEGIEKAVEPSPVKIAQIILPKPHPPARPSNHAVPQPHSVPLAAALPSLPLSTAYTPEASLLLPPTPPVSPALPSPTSFSPSLYSPHASHPQSPPSKLNRNKPFTNHPRNLREPPPLNAVAALAQAQREADPGSCTLQNIAKRDKERVARFSAQGCKGLGAVDPEEAREVMLEAGDKAEKAAEASGDGDGKESPKDEEGEVSNSANPPLRRLFARSTIETRFPSSARHLVLPSTAPNSSSTPLLPLRPFIQDAMQINLLSRGISLPIVVTAFNLFQRKIREIDPLSPLLQFVREQARQFKDFVSALFALAKDRARAHKPALARFEDPELARAKSIKCCAPAARDAMLAAAQEVLDKIERKEEGYAGQYDWGENKGALRLPLVLDCLVRAEAVHGSRLSTPSNVDAACRSAAVQMGTSVAVNGNARIDCILTRLVRIILTPASGVPDLFPADISFAGQNAGAQRLLQLLSNPSRTIKPRINAMYGAILAVLSTTSLDQEPSAEVRQSLLDKLRSEVELAVQSWPSRPPSRELEQLAQVLLARTMSAHAWFRSEADKLDNANQALARGRKGAEMESGVGGDAGKGKTKRKSQAEDDGAVKRRKKKSDGPRGSIANWRGGEGRLSKLGLGLVMEGIEFRLVGQYHSFTFAPQMWAFDIHEELVHFFELARHPEQLGAELTRQLHQAGQAEQTALASLADELHYLETFDTPNGARAIRITSQASIDADAAQQLLRSALGTTVSDAGRSQRINLAHLFLRPPNNRRCILSGTGQYSAQRINLGVFRIDQVQANLEDLKNVQHPTQGGLLSSVIKDKRGGTYAKPFTPLSPLTLALDQRYKTTRCQHLRGGRAVYERRHVVLPFAPKGDYQGPGAARPLRLLARHPALRPKVKYLPSATGEKGVGLSRRLFRLNEATGEGSLEKGVGVVGVDPGQVKTEAISSLTVGSAEADWMTVSGRLLEAQDRHTKVVLERERKIDPFVDVIQQAEVVAPPGPARSSPTFIDLPAARSFSRAEERARQLNVRRKAERSSRHAQIFDALFPRKTLPKPQKVLLTFGNGFGGAGSKGKGVRRLGVEQQGLLTAAHARPDLEVGAVVVNEKWTSQIDPSPLRRAQAGGMNKVLSTHFADGSTAHRLKQAPSSHPVLLPGFQSSPLAETAQSSAPIFPVLHRDEIGAQNTIQKAVFAAVTGKDLYENGPHDKGVSSKVAKGGEKTQEGNDKGGKSKGTAIESSKGKGRAKGRAAGGLKGKKKGKRTQFESEEDSEWEPEEKEDASISGTSAATAHAAGPPSTATRSSQREKALSTVDRCLAEHKPSANARPNEWYWLRSEEGRQQRGDLEGLLEEGTPLVKQLVKDCEEIKRKFPTWNSRWNGKTRKQHLNDLHSTFRSQAADLASSFDNYTGKWLLYASSSKVDSLWAKVVHAVVGKKDAFKTTGTVPCAKVAAAAEDGDYVVEIYTPNAYDRAQVSEVLEVILQQIKETPVAYKPDAYTHLGIYSRHPSGLSPVLYHPTDFFTSVEIDNMLDKVSRAQASKRKTLEEELKDGGAHGFDEVLSSDSERED